MDPMGNTICWFAYIPQFFKPPAGEQNWLPV